MKSLPSKVLIFVLCLVLLSSNMFEAYFQQSFRAHLTALSATLFSAFFLFKPKFNRNALIYLIVLLLYLVIYYLFGPANYLIIHVYTILLGTVLLFNVLVLTNYGPRDVWGLVTRIWGAIYITLLGEILLVVLGYQQVLYDIFPESNRERGLPAYRSIVNMFSNYFELDYHGLNSIVLAIQSYGQLCVMLTIFGFTYTDTKNRSFLKNGIIFLFLPLLMFLNSPNVTSSIVFLSIIACNVFVKQYIGIYSLTKTVTMYSSFALLVAAVFYADEVGFLRKYDLAVFYAAYVAPQFDYVFNRSVPELLIGMDPKKFVAVSFRDEVGIMTYATATGLLFLFSNIVLLLYLMSKNLRQVKTLYAKQLCKGDYLDTQIKNLIFIAAALVSSIHYPVIFDFVMGGLFILNLSFCLFNVNENEKIIAQGGAS